MDQEEFNAVKELMELGLTQRRIDLSSVRTTPIISNRDQSAGLAGFTYGDMETILVQARVNFYLYVKEADKALRTIAYESGLEYTGLNYEPF